MKQLILLTLVGLFGIKAYSQTLNVVSTFPADGAIDVNTDSIMVTFDTKLNFEVDEFGESNVYLFIEPEDSTSYDSVKISSDSLTVTFYGNLTDNTDFLGIVEYAVGINGEMLTEPYLFQFTTYPEAGPFTVSGTVEGMAAEQTAEARPVIVFLSNENLDLGFDQEEECDPQIMDCEDEIVSSVLYAVIADPATGQYSVSGVREGTYFVLGIEYYYEGDEYNEEYYMPDLYFHDNDGDQTPDRIEINSTTAPNNELTDIDLYLLDLSPVTFKTSVARSASLTTEFGDDVLFIGGGVELSLSAEGVFPKKSSVSYTRPSSRFKQIAHNVLEHSPDGKSIIWQQYYYDTQADVAFVIVTSPLGSFIEDTVTQAEAELPVAFTTLKPLPESFIDSDSAVYIAEANGGAEFRAPYENDVNAIGYLELELLHQYWELEENATTDAPVFWSIEYYYYSFNDQTYEYTEDSARIFINAETGVILENTLPVNNESESVLPNGFELGQNYPNPFNPATSIPFTLSKAGRISIEIYNLLGQNVATLTDALYSAGSHTITWDATGYSSGIYMYRMSSNGFVQTKKLLLLK